MRRRLLLPAGLAVAVLVAACDDDERAAPPASAVSIPAAGPTASGVTEVDDEFPVTIEHFFGETVVPEAPQRVVVAGLNEADHLYSLGIAPVGVHEWFGDFPFATGPWADAVRVQLGAEPDVLEGFDINVEWVASLDPDLIVATYHEVDETLYDQLSAIAPVVAAPAGPDVEEFAAPWRVQYRLIADAVGRRARAEQVIAEVDATIEQIKAQHPAFAGATFDTGVLADDGGLRTFSSGDLTNQAISELGLRVPPSFDAIADGVYITIAAERFDLLDELDTFIWLDETGEMPDLAAGIPTFAATRLHREGREVLPERDAVMAIAFNTPLSIPYYLDELVPLLEAALDGDPET